ncbi:MAG: phosphatase PAP2 family protein [Phycisphaerales bacterium]|nr:phosphatase PAP2 family protein [Phycisphaerales bacterium]
MPRADEPLPRWNGGGLSPAGAAAVLAAGVLVGLLLLPIDGAVHGLAERWRPRGDIRRELEALQQFGAVGSMVVISLAILCLDRGRFRRVLDWLLAAGLSSLAVSAVKMLAGRVRPGPGDGDPWRFLGPLGVSAETSHPALHFWASGAGDAWSMPSNHTATAVVAAVFLGVMYPRLRPLVLGLALLVGAARVLLGAHFPSDVAVGAAVGLAVGLAAVKGMWGVRLVDWVWRVAVDRRARPAWVRQMELERRRPR